MRSRYKCGDMHGIINYKGTNSVLWKQITKSIPYIMSACVWSIGDGRSIKAWSNDWLEAGTDINEYHIQIPEEIGREMISDITIENGEWN